MKGDNAENAKHKQFKFTCRALFYDRDIAASIDHLSEPTTSDVPHTLGTIVRAFSWSIILYNYVGINHRV
jgi:hypothetical protein